MIRLEIIICASFAVDPQPFSMCDNRVSVILRVPGETQRRVGTTKSKTI
jgi:hypothetical protein